MSFLFNIVEKFTNYFKSKPSDSRDSHCTRFYAGSNETQVHIQRNNVKGIVTFLAEGRLSGRIDGYINFDGKTNITYQCAEGKIVVGSEVLVDLTRNTKISPWFVNKMVVLTSPKGISDWSGEENEDEDEIVVKVDENVEKSLILPQKQVGMITYSYNGDLTLNNDIKFRQKDCGANSFRPIKGDWVVVQFDHEIRQNRVVSISPLRYVDYEGQVNSFRNNKGYIDREIFFNSYVTKNVNVRPGTRVYGTAIESVQGKNCNFRALTVFINNSNAFQGLRMRVKTTHEELENIINPKMLGIDVSATTVDFGEQSINCVANKSLIIENKKDELLKISNIKLSSETNDQFIIDDVEGHNLLKNEPLTINIRCQPQFPGLDTQKLIIEGVNSVEKPWKIVFDVSVYVNDPISRDFSMGKSPNKVLTKPTAMPASDTVSGIYLPAAKPLKISTTMTKMYPHKLKMYPIPLELEDHVVNKEDLNLYYPQLTETLNPGNYSDKMNLLVHLEEINTKEEMKQFIMEDVRMMSRRDTFGIEVPGLTEGRPSLMMGDKVIIQLSGPENPTYSGNIEEIMSNCIFVKFHPTLHSTYTNELCRVSFQHSRLPFRRMHLGIDMACSNLGDEILFPSNINKKSSQCVRLSRQGLNELSAANFVKEEVSNLLHLKFYNNNLNELQRVAVVRMLHGYSRPLPYVLFGPPGTGKTVTLVEAVLQVYKSVPSSRILLCAPSNSAADLLCLRLHQSSVIETGEMVRMNAYRRSILSEISDKEPIPPKILPYCKSIDELSEVAMHRIIITTCISSGALYQLGLKSGHISHVFVDEAGQASEPEIMVCLGIVSALSGQVILAGDPMQLGPVIRSKIARGLEESYLHRLLLSSSLYQKQKQQCPGSTTYYNPLVVTQLLNNYRAHPTLLKLPSDMFYDSNLVACTGVEKTMFLNWSWLPNPLVPLVFQAVRGKELRNDRNPSTYNPSEAVMVVRWIGRILQDSSQFSEGFDFSKISVITPYRAQVDCIRKMIRSCLEDVNLAKLKVGSVEEFQGQENEVIIISTVRSSLDNNSGGNNEEAPHESLSLINTLSSRLKFLSNKRRFNVSITRACSLLIVIGDPSLLKYDGCWNTLMKYAKDNSAYLGTN